MGRLMFGLGEKPFDYFSIYSYYPSKDNIYLLCSKETIYTYCCYGKQTGKVKVKSENPRLRNNVG